MAQTLVKASAPQASRADAGVEEVVVTASKRTQSVEKIPAAVTAITGATLAQAGITDVQDLSEHAPNFNIGVNGTTSGLDVGIRGITTQNDDWAGNPAIAVSMDGVYVARTQGLNQGLFDLDRVEILRGPQGTLYGRNATGGAVNIVPASPQLGGYHAAADFSYGNYNSVISHGMVNIPVSDTVAIRFAGASDRDDGLVRSRLATGPYGSPTGPSGPATDNYDRANNWSGRASLLWKPDDRFTGRISLDGLVDNGAPALPVSAPQGSQSYTYLLFEPPIFAPTPTLVNSLNQQNPFDRVVNTGGKLDLHIWNIRGHADYKFDDVWSISYVGGYGQLDRKSSLDSDGSNVNSGNTRSTDTEYSTSHEIDLKFEGSRVKWIAGGNYFYEHESGDLAVDEFGPLIFPNGAPQFPETLQLDHPDNTQYSYGLFTQATVSVTPKLRLTGGVRYSYDEHAFNGGEGTYFCSLQSHLGDLSACNPLYTPADGFPNFGPAPGQFSEPNPRSDHWSNVSWKAGLEYDLTPKTLTYVTAGTGYKAGGLGDGFGQPNYQPEKVLNIEGGLKTRLFDNTVRLSTSLFGMKYDNYQVTQDEALAYLPTQIPGFPAAVTNLVTTNAAKATIYGAEFEASWKPSPDDHIDGYFSYLHANFDRFTGAEDLVDQPGRPAAGVLPPVLTLSGNRLIRSPRVSGRVSYAHDFQFADGSTLTPAASAYLQSLVFLREINAPVDRQGGYGLFDATLSYELPGHRVRIVGFVKNLTDKRYRVAEFASVFSLNSLYGDPRTYGFRLSYAF